MFSESSNISLVEEFGGTFPPSASGRIKVPSEEEMPKISLVDMFGGFRITKNGPVPIQLPNRFVYAVRAFRNRLERMSAYVNVL